MQIQITGSSPKFWYYGLEFQTFEAELVEMPVAGHAHKIKVYEVLEGEHAGNFVLQGDCQAQQDLFESLPVAPSFTHCPKKEDLTFSPRC